MRSKVILIFATCLFGFCFGEPECGRNQCKDLWTAKKCNKVKYCVTEEWSKLKPTGNRDSICDICLEMVKEARDTLRSNETREELLEVFEGSCRLLHIKTAIKLCDDLVDMFVPELVYILSSEMDPESVCTVSKLCNNDVFAASLKNSKSCIYCESFTEALTEKMKSLTQEQFKNGIIDLCRTAGSFSDACYYISSIYSESFYNNSKSILNGKPCESTLLCPSGPTHPQSMVKIKKKMCPLCRNVMTSLKKQLLNVKSSEEFADKMFKICEKFNFPYNTCHKISDPTLFEKLKNHDSTHLLCRMTFCREKLDKGGMIWPLIPSDDESFILTKDLDPIELLENFEMFFPEINQEKTEIPMTTEVVRPTIAYGDPIDNPMFFAPIVGGPSFKDCKTCTHVLGMLESNYSRKTYSEKTFNAVCDNAENVELCKEFVNNFSHILIKAFAEGFASKKMCEDLVPSCIIKRDDNKPEALENANCDLCLNLVEIAKHSDPKIWNELFEKECDSLPENSRDMCIYTLSNISSVLKNYGGNEMCRTLKLCSPSNMKLGNVYDTNFIGKENYLCKRCILSLEKVIDIVKKNDSDEIFRVIFESVCLALPNEMRKICHVIEIASTDKIKSMVQNMNPVDVCDLIHICSRAESNATTSLPNLSAEVTLVDPNERIPCKFCLMAIKMLLDNLENDKTEDAIRAALDKLCSYFPEETQSTCRNLIDQYTEDLIDMIIADFNATEICMFLKICPEPRFSVSYTAVDQSTEDSNKNLVVYDVKTNEVLDWNEEPVFESYTEKAIEMPSQMFLEKLHDYVRECALCEALVGVIASHRKMQKENYDFSKNGVRICSIVPVNDIEKCLSLVISYGPSIVNLIRNGEDINEICVHLKLCEPEMQAKVNQPVSVPEDKFVQKEIDCTQGPKFWCANAENAEKCGTFLHCQETVWKNWENPPKRPTAQ